MIALIAGKDLAARAADAVKDLRRTVQEWSNFYNDFDPLFTWWMGQPYRQTAKALEDYDKFLRDRVSAAVPEAKAPAAAPVNIDAALPPAFAEVPDLTAGGGGGAGPRKSRTSDEGLLWWLVGGSEKAGF